MNYVQPDVCHAGGILEMKKIGTIAEAYRVEMAPHNPQSEVSTLASLHVDATTPACTIQEYNPNNTPGFEICSTEAPVQVKEGFAELPSRPGLGVDLNEKVAAQHPYKPVNPPELCVLRRRRGRSLTWTSDQGAHVPHGECCAYQMANGAFFHDLRDNKENALNRFIRE